MARRKRPLPTPDEVFRKLAAGGVKRKELRAAFAALRFAGGAIGARADQMRIPRHRAAAFGGVSALLNRHRQLFCTPDQHPIERTVTSAYQGVESAMQVLGRALEDAAFGANAVAISGLLVGATNMVDLYLRLKELRLPEGQRVRDLDLAVLTVALIPGLVVAHEEGSYEEAVTQQHSNIRARLSRYRRRVLRLPPDGGLHPELAAALTAGGRLRIKKLRSKRVTR